MTPEKIQTMSADDPIIYQVMILSAIHCTPLYPYIGKDKEIAIAIASAYIARGETTTTINELKASELRARFDHENQKKGKLNDIQTNQNDAGGEGR